MLAFVFIFLTSAIRICIFVVVSVALTGFILHLLASNFQNVCVVFVSTIQIYLKQKCKCIFVILKYENKHII